MTHCSKCERDVDPVHEVQASGRIVPCCPYCTGSVEAVPATIEASGVAPVAVRAVTMAPPSRAPAPPVHADVDVLSLARAELTSLEERIVALTALKTKAAKLRAMIAAADSTNDSEN